MGSERKRKRDPEDGSPSMTISNSFTQSGHDIAAPSEPGTKRLQQRRTLFVRALPPTITTDKFIEHFSEAFPIKHAIVVTDPTTKLCKGYGFITFADAEDAQKASQDFNNTVLDGRKIKLELAESRHRDVQEGLPRETWSAKIHESKSEAVKGYNEQSKSPPKLIVRNLPWSIKTADQLTRLFLSYGKVKSAVVPQKKPGLQSGFGFVTIRGRKNAEKALNGVNGLQLDGRTLAVDWAVDRDTWQAQNQLSGSGMGGDIPDSLHCDSGEETLIAQEDTADEYEQKNRDVSRQHDGAMIEHSDSVDESKTDDEETDEGKSMTCRSPERDHASTIFIRNLPFTSTNDALQEHFRQFGGIRYARIVIDPVTERPRGTGFVCFYKATDAEDCLKAAPRDTAGLHLSDNPRRNEQQGASRSVLQSEDADPTGKFTLEGRILQVSRAVDRSEAARLTQVGVERRGHRDNDKRRLYLLSEGTISTSSALFPLLSPSELAMREQSAKQRKTMVQSNPSLNLSLTRLSVRNIPRTITSKDLKQLAREAVVGFASDVKVGKRAKISREELSRDSIAMTEAEKDRKAKRKGLVKQAKVVFEGREGAKIQEQSGAGRSRGYGFIEYHTHRAALMGLRWLNGHAIEYETTDTEKGSGNRHSIQGKNKRLIVEFAIENAQVVHRRKQREQTARNPNKRDIGTERGQTSRANKETRNDSKQKPAAERLDVSKTDSKRRSIESEKLATRARIIAKKRAQRRDRKKAGRAIR